MAKKTEAELEAAALEKEQRAAAVDVDDEVLPEGEIDDEPENRNNLGMKRHVNETREAIMDKAASSRAARRKADTDQLDDVGKRRQDAMEAEVRGEPNEFDADPPEEEEADSPEGAKPGDEKPSDSVDSNDQMVKITVDGSDQEVTQSAVEKAGIAALQKESSADKRMKEATKFEGALRNLESTLRKQAEDLDGRQKDIDANPPANADAVAADVTEQSEAVAAAIYSGDQDQVRDSLAGLITSVAQGRPKDSTPPLDAKQFAQDVRTQIEQLDASEVAETAAVERSQVAKTVNSTFEEEFSELFEDDRGFRLTKAEFEGLCQEKPNADRVALMREAATTVDTLINPPVGDELSRRKARKRGADAETPSSSQRIKSDTPKRAPTRKETVRRMAAKRGQRL